MQNWSILAKFAKRNPAKSAVFYWLFLGEVSPRNFPWNRPILLRTCPWKSFKIWLFCTETREIGRFFCEFWLCPANIPRNRLIFPRILTFFPRNWPIFPQICPWKSREIFLFFREISEALLSATGLLPSLKVKVKVETNKDSSSIKVRKFLNGREENKTLATPYPLPTNSVQMPVNFHNFGELHLCSLWNLAILLTLILSGVFT